MQKVALITGASSGIGKELARIHAERSGDLIIVARRESILNDLKEELESQFDVTVKTIIKDLSKMGAAKEVYEEVQNANIEVEYLINNAGFGLRGKFHELSLSRQQEMMQLNMIALTELTYLFLQDFTKRGFGKILNNSSTASYMPGPLQAVYFASKSYVQFFSNALAEELYDTSITVTNLMPGATQTEFAQVSGTDKTNLFDKTVSARSVAQDGYSAMLRGDLDVVSGLTCMQKLMVKSIPFTPKKIMLKQIRKMQEVK